VALTTSIVFLIMYIPSGGLFSSNRFVNCSLQHLPIQPISHGMPLQTTLCIFVGAQILRVLNIFIVIVVVIHLITTAVQIFIICYISRHEHLSYLELKLPMLPKMDAHVEIPLQGFSQLYCYVKLHNKYGYSLASLLPTNTPSSAKPEARPTEEITNCSFQCKKVYLQEPRLLGAWNKKIRCLIYCDKNGLVLANRKGKPLHKIIVKPDSYVYNFKKHSMGVSTPSESTQYILILVGNERQIEADKRTIKDILSRIQSRKHLGQIQ